jgi:hypothetical protein
MNDVFFDYFAIFKLEERDGREANYAKLNGDIRKTVIKRQGEAGDRQQKVLNHALEIFGNEDKYQVYLKELKERSPSFNDAELSKKLAEEQRKAQAAQKEAEAAKRQADQAQRDRIRLEQERQRIEREAEERRRKHDKELEEERRRREEAEEREREAREKAESSQKPVWQQLLGKLANQVVDNLTAPQQHTSLPPNNFYDTSPVQPSISLTGFWRDPQGVVYQINHQGNRLTIQARNPLGVVIVVGEGTVFGQNVQIVYQNYFYRSQGRANLQVSPDGRSLNGMLSDSMLGYVPAVLFR